MTITNEYSAAIIGMRAACLNCGGADGHLKTSAQDTVRCASCGRHCYNATRKETGRSVRSPISRPEVRSSQRVRVLQCDRGACFICGCSNVPLQIGRIVSVREGRALGLSDAELFHDDSLVVALRRMQFGPGLHNHAAAIPRRCSEDGEP